MDKKCFNCSRKIEKNFIFCPYCGENIKREEDGRNFGFLGIDDEVDGLNMMPGFNGLFNNLMKELSRQLNDSNSFEKGISVNLNSLGGKPIIRVKQLNGKQEMKINNSLSEEQIMKRKALPKKEAEASVRRMSNKLIYEISLPGVKSMNNILINKLENGIEIRAFSEDTSYFKILPVNLPIVNYGFDKNKLVLEMSPK